jgi:molybdopterin-guanine dinucleotide biosynthesis protein A
MTGTGTRGGTGGLPGLPPVSAIVLAGGRSRRFGRDKLAEPAGGRTLLQRAIAAVAPIASEVVVVASPGATPDVPSFVRVAYDETAFEGPLAGCFAGLLAAREPLVIVVGGDMPDLQPEVLAGLIRALEGSAADASALEHLGRARPLPMALRTGSGTEVARRLLADRERRLGALLERLTVRVIPEVEWRPLDPTARTVLDVDEPGDLARFENPDGLTDEPG